MPTGIQADRRAHRRKLVPALLKLDDERVERGDRLRPVATAVMQHHDRPAVVLGSPAPDDGVDPGTLPISRVEVGVDDSVIPGALDGLPFRGR